MGLYDSSDGMGAPGKRRRFNVIYLQVDPYSDSLVDYWGMHSPGRAKTDDALPSLSSVCRGSSLGTDNL